MLNNPQIKDNIKQEVKTYLEQNDNNEVPCGKGSVEGKDYCNFFLHEKNKARKT